MIDGNISMEEDTELRDLVVQTLENNGALAKVRAELRASLFLALEEQASVMNPEPLLNKTVKQYLSKSEGKLLFSLVREFLEYFGLDCTISVYDPETYFGKEYNYIGRSKLCEELGIKSSEPLLGEILRSRMNGAFNNTQKNETIDNTQVTNNESENFPANATYDISAPKVLENESSSFSNENDSSDKVDSITDQSPKIPINVTITDKKNKLQAANSLSGDIIADSDKEENILRENTNLSKNLTHGIESEGNNNNVDVNKIPTSSNNTIADINHLTQETEIITPTQTISLNTSEPLIKFDQSILTETKRNQNEDINKQNNINSMDLQIALNVQNKKSLNTESCSGKTVYFEEIIVDGKKENVNTIHKAEPFLGNLPPLDHKANSIFTDLPPLNGKKTNLNDLKELMTVGLAPDGIDTYEEDFMSSASGSANEQSPSKDPDKTDDLRLQLKKEEKTHSAHSEDISEEIEEIDDLLSSTSCLEDVNMDKNVSNFATGITADYIEKM